MNIKSDDTSLLIIFGDGKFTRYSRGHEESLAAWYLRSFQIIADSLGFSEMLVKEVPERIHELVENGQNLFK